MDQVSEESEGSEGVGGKLRNVKIVAMTNDVIVEHFENSLGKFSNEKTCIQENHLKIFNRNYQILAGKLRRFRIL